MYILYICGSLIYLVHFNYSEQNFIHVTLYLLHLHKLLHLLVHCVRHARRWLTLYNRHACGTASSPPPRRIACGTASYLQPCRIACGTASSLPPRRIACGTALSLPPRRTYCMSHSIVSATPPYCMSHSIVYAQGLGTPPATPPYCMSHGFVSAGSPYCMSHSIVSATPPYCMSHSIVSATPPYCMSHGFVSAGSPYYAKLSSWRLFWCCVLHVRCFSWQIEIMIYFLPYEHKPYLCIHTMQMYMHGYDVRYMYIQGFIIDKSIETLEYTYIWKFILRLLYKKDYARKITFYRNGPQHGAKLK